MSDRGGLTRYAVLCHTGAYDSRDIYQILADAHAHYSAEHLAHMQRPIDMVLHCPKCGEQHIDAPELRSVTLNRVRNSHAPAWTNPPHRTHLCHSCGRRWRPADVATNGVAAVKTKGKDDDPLEVMRQIRMRDAAQPKLDWDGERP